MSARVHVLIAGVSTRAAAESAARAGFEVTAIDAFGDRDQHAAVRALSMRRDVGARFTPAAVARVARAVPREAAVYLSNFDNHPRAVATLAVGGAVWGNPPDVLRRVRDPEAVAEAFRGRGLPTPDVRRDAPARGAARWLLKPVASGGGHGVRWWRGTRVPARAYLQAYVQGVPASVAFVADGERAVLLGITRQLVGEPAFGSSGFRYCGNIFSTSPRDALADPRLVTAAVRLVGAVVEDFGLVGVGGIDVVVHDHTPVPVEVNPRWTGSLEAIERAVREPLFAAHVAACRDGRLPDAEAVGAAPGRAVGKAIVFTRAEVTIGDTSGWLADPDVRDVPHEGEHVAAGGPVCTVFAEGVDAVDCHARLVERAERIYEDLASWMVAAVNMGAGSEARSP